MSFVQVENRRNIEHIVLYVQYVGDQDMINIVLTGSQYG